MTKRTFQEGGAIFENPDFPHKTIETACREFLMAGKGYPTKLQVDEATFSILKSHNMTEFLWLDFVKDGVELAEPEVRFSVPIESLRHSEPKVQFIREVA
jgi:hypothetical protein